MRIRTLECDAIQELTMARVDVKSQDSRVKSQSNLSACMIAPYLFAIHPVCKQNRRPSVMPTSCGQWTSASMMINVNAEHIFHQRNPLR